jgi:hypothetical protein
VGLAVGAIGGGTHSAGGVCFSLVPYAPRVSLPLILLFRGLGCEKTIFE